MNFFFFWWKLLRWQLWLMLSSIWPILVFNNSSRNCTSILDLKKKKKGWDTLAVQTWHLAFSLSRAFHRWCISYSTPRWWFTYQSWSHDYKHWPITSERWRGTSNQQRGSANRYWCSITTAGEIWMDHYYHRHHYHHCNHHH